MAECSKSIEQSPESSRPRLCSKVGTYKVNKQTNKAGWGDGSSETPPLNTQQAWSSHLAALGYSVFPLVAGKKIPPMGMHWTTMSSCNPREIAEWWSSNPYDNLGVNCGQSGILVVDLDSEDAADRWDYLWDARSDHPWDTGRYPVVQTRRGWHIYFDTGKTELPNTAGKLGEGIDTRGKGGMVVGPGSVVKDHRYELVRGDLGKVPPCPDWLAKKLQPAPRPVPRPPVAASTGSRWLKPSRWAAERKLLQACCRIETAPDGEQNNTINNAAFTFFHYCPPLDIEVVREELEAAAERGNHPARRYMPTIRSGLTHAYNPEKCPFRH